MAKIITALPDGKRWKQKTVIGVVEDSDPVEKSFPPALYEITKTKLTVSEVESTLQAKVTEDVLYTKRISTGKLSEADLTNLENQSASKASLLMTLSKTEYIAASLKAAEAVEVGVK
jgi:hypothetical protein